MIGTVSPAGPVRESVAASTSSAWAYTVQKGAAPPVTPHPPRGFGFVGWRSKATVVSAIRAGTVRPKKAGLAQPRRDHARFRRGAGPCASNGISVPHAALRATERRDRPSGRSLGRLARLDDPAAVREPPAGPAGCADDREVERHRRSALEVPTGVRDHR